MRSVFLLTAAVGLAWYALALADDGRASRDHALVTWSDVGAPLGKVLLIRRGSDLCAVRFTDVRRGNDKKDSTIFDSGEESFYGEYDWHTFDKPPAQASTGHRKVSRTSSKGLGRLAFQSGEPYVRCGAFTLRWMYPTRVTLFSGDRRP